MAAKKKIKWDVLRTPHPFADRKLSTKQLLELERWHNFLDRQGGCYPSRLAANRLRMTTEGVRKAAARGWILYVQVGNLRFYGKKDVENYRQMVSRKFKFNRPQTDGKPRQFRLDSDD